jgi:hypothetical protein
MRDFICLVWATMLFGYSTLEARVGASGAVPPAQAESAQKPTVKERILEIPPGTMIEVRLLNKQKIRGRLGEITNEVFSLQIARGNKIETQKVAFTDVKSLKKFESGEAGKMAGGVVIGILAALGILAVIGIIGAATRD